MATETKSRTFALGRLAITSAAMTTLNEEDVRKALERHSTCDWGDCCPEDEETNESALDQESRLFSIYHDREGTKFWVITEADRSATTILLPEDY